MTPLDHYHEQCKAGFIFEDPQQLDALHKLQHVYEALLIENTQRNGLFAFLRKPHLVKGIYLWGSVGIGKTFLMDCFYQSLPFPQKLRIHFYQFMQQIHRELTQHQGEKDPLLQIAEELANKTLVLCFDELFVSDITDAMLLGRLFRYLFEKGVCLVATSNAAPDNLYKHGLQREQFLPAIKLLKLNTQVTHIPTTIDYRLRHLQEAGVFYTPLNAESRDNMEKSFSSLTEGKTISHEPIMIHDRFINIVKRSDDIIWFEFDEICRVPRSQNDYLAIASQYKTVLISNIPVIDAREKDTICLFISLVDVFYDARVRLVISAAEPVAELYSRGYMIVEYTRTHSRLLEMQSVDYFSGEH